MILAVDKNEGWTPEAEVQRIINDAYVGFENTQVYWLLKTLPRGYMELSDLWQTVRMWSLEAVDIFDVTANTKFGTFLFGHLRLCSRRFQEAPYRPSKSPKGRQVVLFSQGSKSSAGSNLTLSDYGQRSNDSTNKRQDGKQFDRSIDDANSFNPSMSSYMQVEELMAALSPESRTCFAALSKVEDQKTLREAFQAYRWRHRVSQLTGIEIRRLEVFRKEIEQVAPAFV